MKKIIIFLIFFSLFGCSKPKTVFICGDHICVNKSEAERYFEENLTLEVKIIDKKKIKTNDLVQLNLNSNLKGERKINILKKNYTDKKLKTLSNHEVRQVKNNLKKIRKKNKKVKDKVRAEKMKNKKVKKKNKSLAKLKAEKTAKKVKKTKLIKDKSVNKANKEVVDICTILEKCSIDEISKYLIKQGKEKNFPDIRIKE